DDRADAGERRCALAGQLVAEQLHGAGGRPREPEQQAHQRGLAGTVASEEPERAAARDLQVDRLQRGPRAEALAEAGGLEGEGAHARNHRAAAPRAHRPLEPTCAPLSYERTSRT